MYVGSPSGVAISSTYCHTPKSGLIFKSSLFCCALEVVMPRSIMAKINMIFFIIVDVKDYDL